MSLFRGGVDTVEVADAPDFTLTGSGGNATFIVTFDEFTQEGNSWPDPEQVSDTLADDQEGPTGVNVPFNFRAIDVDEADVQTIEDEGYGLAGLYFRFTSQDGKTQMVLLGVIPSILTSPIADRGVFGVVKVAGMATGIRPSDAYTVTHTP